MDARKIIRDSVVIVVIAVAVIVIFASRRPGPVERVSGTIPSDSQTQSEQTPAGHPQESPEFSDGEPLVTLDGEVMGTEWFDRTVADFTEDYVSQGIDEQSAGHQARFETLLAGLQELATRKAIIDYGIQPDSEMMAAQEGQFHASFESQEQEQQLLSDMGMTMERVRALWELQAIKASLRRHVAAMRGIDPNSDEVDQAMADWTDEMVFSSDYVFSDPELKELFEEYRTMATEGLLGRSAEPEEGEEPAGEGGQSDTDNPEINE